MLNLVFSIARHVQKHSRLLAVVESLDNGKTVRETRDCDVPLVARHLYYHAGWAQLMDTEMKGWKSIGGFALVYTYSCVQYSLNVHGEIWQLSHICLL